MYKNKKAITPLISTIMLIIFAAGLGLLVMSWGQKNTGTMLDCGSAEFDIVEFNAIKQICIEDNTIDFTMENKGSVDIDSIKIIIFGTVDIEKINLVKDLLVGDAQRFKVGYGNIGETEKIMFTPSITYLNEKKLCPSKSIEAIPRRC